MLRCFIEILTVEILWSVLRLFQWVNFVDISSICLDFNYAQRMEMSKRSNFGGCSFRKVCYNKFCLMSLSVKTKFVIVDPSEEPKKHGWESVVCVVCPFCIIAFILSFSILVLVWTVSLCTVFLSILALMCSCFLCVRCYDAYLFGVVVCSALYRMQLWEIL